jgi:hypothetical protein
MHIYIHDQGTYYKGQRKKCCGRYCWKLCLPCAQRGWWVLKEREQKAPSAPAVIHPLTPLVGVSLAAPPPMKARDAWTRAKSERYLVGSADVMANMRKQSVVMEESVLGAFATPISDKLVSS